MVHMNAIGRIERKHADNSIHKYMQYPISISNLLYLKYNRTNYRKQEMTVQHFHQPNTHTRWIRMRSQSCRMK